jgi:NADPH-dependent 7-cyano-7-deazaguanine reductase QueF
MSPELTPTDATVTMRVKASIRHLCPFVQEVDDGHVTVDWDTDGWTFELHSLRAYLRSFTDREISHEDLTEEVRAELSSHHGIKGVTVTTTWRTAGMEINCSTSPIPVAQQ